MSAGASDLLKAAAASSSRPAPDEEAIQQFDRRIMRDAISEVWSKETDRKKVARKLAQAELNTTDVLTLPQMEINNRLRDAGDKALSSASTTALQQAIHRCRLDVAIHGKTPIVFSAPHTIELQRDGQPKHKVEDFTSPLARLFADVTGGGHILWREEERERVRALGGPCPTNRDPNFLSDAELGDSAWFTALRCAREELAPSGRPCIHVDVHGMRNPPAYPVDCLVGTLAMRRQHGDARTDALCDEVERVLRPVLQRIPIARPAAAEGEGGGDSAADVVGAMAEFMDLQAGGAATPAPLLGGDWGVGSGRNTLTQLSTNRGLWTAHAAPSGGPQCFACALQIELSMRLRRHLADNWEDRQAFAEALGSLVSLAW